MSRKIDTELSRKARNAFVKEFNWQAVSRRTYERIKALVPRHASSEFDFGWIGENSVGEGATVFKD